MKILVLGMMLAALAGPALAQPPGAYEPARNALGRPDFTGTWSMNSLTRLERPGNVENLVLTEEQARTPPRPILPSDGVGTAESDPVDTFQSDWARLGDEIRSSWLIEPSDGRLPFSEDGAALLRAPGPPANDNPEGRSTYERCLAMPQGGPPMLNAAYNNNIAFVQTPDHVAIWQEANHEVRVIRLNTRQHGPVRQWFGDSIGWWEGDTLVVETTQFTPSQSRRLASTARLVMSPDAKVMERFTRISDSQIKYEFAVDDPAVFTQMWKGEIPLTLTPEPTFEYACHEGNYGLENILAGARYEEGRYADQSE
jgi:hypothetical protein